jgi:hypothetical protein
MTPEPEALIAARTKRMEAYEAWQETCAEYENEWAERVATAKAVIRGELKPLMEKRDEAYRVYLAAGERVKAEGGR